MLKSKKEIVEHLKNTGACESQLSEICEADTVYFTVYPDTDYMLDLEPDVGINCSEYVALTIVKCKEGYIIIPVIDFNPNAGFEQFDLEEVKDADKSLVEYYYEKTAYKAKLIKTLLD